MLGDLLQGTLWLAAIGLIAIIVVFAIVVGFVRRATGTSDPGGRDSGMSATDRDDALR